MVSPTMRPMPEEFIYSSLRGEPDFSELLTFFVEELPRVSARLLDVARAGQFDDLKRESHKIRGSAGGYGFQGISDLAGKLEESCRNPVRDEQTILRNLDELLEYLGKVRA